MKTKSTILIAYMPNPKDWIIATDALWYRIPKDNAPKIIKEQTAEYIGFYFPSNFGEAMKWKVTHYGKIKSITEVNRKELFPEEPINSKSAIQYYKITFEVLLLLPIPFQSRRGHRVIFVSTTKEKFFSGKTDFNLLFHNSSHEKEMEKIMDSMSIEYEREWREYVDRQKFYYLDFAVWCKKGVIDIECDGDAFHMDNDRVHYDKTRNNELESYGWSVLRFTTKHFNEDTAHIEKTIYKTIKELGGAIRVSKPNEPYLPKKTNNNQLGLFE